MLKRKEDISYDIFLNDKNVMEIMDEPTGPNWNDNNRKYTMGKKHIYYYYTYRAE